MLPPCVLFLMRCPQASDATRGLVFAGPDGVVRAATGGEFEGQSVTETSWFQEARLTANRQGRGASLPAGGVAPDRFNGTMTISAPVVDARGDVLGVVGATLSTEWADEIRDSFMRPLAAQDRDRAAAISIGLMSSDGRSVLGAPSGAAMLSADEVRAVAHTGPGLRRLDVGGIPYLAAIGQSGNASASGVDAAGRHEAAKWVVVAGEPEAAIETQTKPIITIIVIAAALSGGIGALLAFVMAARIASPLGWLADEAERIGRQVAAEPGDRFGKLDEISRLSRALEVLATRNENWRVAVGGGAGAGRTRLGPAQPGDRRPAAARGMRSDDRRAQPPRSGGTAGRDPGSDGSAPLAGCAGRRYRPFQERGTTATAMAWATRSSAGWPIRSAGQCVRATSWRGSAARNSS